MFYVDTNTLYIVLILLGFAISLMLAIVGSGVDRSLLIWASSFATHSIGFTLLILRGVISDLLSIWLANVLIASSYTIFAAGLLKFLKRELSPWILWFPVLMMAVSYVFMMDNLNTRILVGGATHFLQFGLLLVIMRVYDHQLTGRGKHILTGCFAVGIVLSLARPLSIVTGATQLDSFDSPGFIQAMTFLGMTIVSVIIALGFVLMQKEQAEAATGSIARTDELTGLPNRRGLYELIGVWMSEQSPVQQCGALMLLDMDNFKSLNDTFGHSAGDEMLKQVAFRLGKVAGSGDTVARLGGDEFVLLLPNLGGEADVAERLALEKAKTIGALLSEPYQLRVFDVSIDAERDIVHHSSATLGIKLFWSGDDHPGREVLLREADKAMYSAKNARRGSVHLISLPD